MKVKICREASKGCVCDDGKFIRHFVRFNAVGIPICYLTAKQETLDKWSDGIQKAPQALRKE